MHPELGHVEGFMYPNEMELQWGVLVVLYPYVTGLVAGAFILASLVRVSDEHALKPTYRLALLSALAFMLVAPLPLQLHLGHPERSFQILMTPNTDSAMAMFGFVYLWYLMAVLVLEIWLDFRKDIVIWAKNTPGWLGWVYRIMTLGSYNISPRALAVDDKVARIVTVVGIPSAFLLHGYVGFIFGSIKANPWWSTPLMPIVFLFSAIVSGIAFVLLAYMAISWLRNARIDMRCTDRMAAFLLYAFIVDFALEMLDLIHRVYEADESFKTLNFMVHSRLFTSQIVLQIFLGTLVPIGLLAFVRLVRVSELARRGVYSLCAILTLAGILAMRWNVVIGGQLFSKSFLGYTTYKMGFATREGLLSAILLMILPLVILWVLVKLLPPFEPDESTSAEHV